MEPPLHVVLLQPEIPNNTGTIGRTVAATGCRLHLVRPLGFEITEKACRRAGLDYWPLLDLRVHEDWEAYVADARPPRAWLLTTKSARPLWEAEIRPGDHLLFGRETAGAPEAVHEMVRDRWGEAHRVTLPMIADPRARSLNLANAATAVLYEGLRQIGWRGAEDASSG